MKWALQNDDAQPALANNTTIMKKATGPSSDEADAALRLEVWTNPFSSILLI